MIDRSDLDSRILLHSVRIAHADRLAPVLAYRSPRRRTHVAVWRKAVGVARPRIAITLVRLAARILDSEPGARLGTGRIVRQPPAELGSDGRDHPVRLAIGPDGALYLTYPAAMPGAPEHPGTLLRIARVGEPSSR